ncbi:MAG: hypothetical protein ABEI13_00155 [Candidatus Paceibacteria bacterium]
MSELPPGKGNRGHPLYSTFDNERVDIDIFGEADGRSVNISRQQIYSRRAKRYIQIHSSTIDAIKRIVEESEEGNTIETEISEVLESHDRDIERMKPVNYPVRLKEHYKTLSSGEKSTSNDLETIAAQIRENDSEINESLYARFVEIAISTPNKKLKTGYLKILIEASEIKNLQKDILHVFKNFEQCVIEPPVSDSTGPDSWGEFRERAAEFLEHMNRTIDKENNEEYRRKLFMVFLETQSNRLD